MPIAVQKAHQSTASWNYVVPSADLVADITHIELAFMQSSVFNQVEPSSWPLFTTVKETRSQFAPGTQIMVAIGGWGDAGFSAAAKTDKTRKLFAKNVRAMIDATGADGMSQCLLCLGILELILFKELISTGSTLGRSTAQPLDYNCVA